MPSTARRRNCYNPYRGGMDADAEAKCAVLDPRQWRDPTVMHDEGDYEDVWMDNDNEDDEELE